MNLNRINILQASLIKGRFHYIINQLDNQVITLEEVWILTEAFIELNKVEKAEKLLQDWWNTIDNTISKAKWFLYKSKCIVLHYDYEKAIEVIQKGKDILSTSKEKNMILKVRFDSELGKIYIKKGHLKEAACLYKNIINNFEFSSSKEHQFLLNKIIYFIGRINCLQGNFEDVLDYYKKSLKFFKKIENYSEIGNSLNSIGIFYDKQGKYEKALEYYKQILGLKEKIEKKIIYGKVLNNIGISYYIQSKLDKSLEYFEQSLRFKKEWRDMNGIAKSLNNIANLSCLQGDLKKGMNYYQQALHKFLQIGNKIEVARVYDNISVIYRNQGQLKKSMNFLRQSLKIRKEIGNQNQIAYSLNNIGICYYMQTKLKKSLEFLQQALEIKEKSKNLIERVELITNIAIVLKEQGKFNIENFIIQKFPKPPFDNLIVESYYQIIQALSAEQKKNWGLAEKAWKEASIIRGQEYHFILLCYESLTAISFLYWLNEPSDKNKTLLSYHLGAWLSLCVNHNLTPSLCKVYLLQAKIALINYQFSLAEKFLNECILTAEEMGLPLYQQLARQDLNKLNYQKELINNRLRDQEKQLKKEHLQDFPIYLKHLPKKFSELSVKKKILFYLLENTLSFQRKIAESINTHRSTVSKITRLMIKDNLIDYKMDYYFKDSQRKVRLYFLTSEGKSEAEKIKGTFEETPITIITPLGEQLKKTINETQKYIFEEFGKEMDFLSISSYMDENKIIWLEDIFKNKKNLKDIYQVKKI
ncbi:MAG: tetratricopeptide repeat protein [Promethearchaeota archaeon]